MLRALDGPLRRMERGINTRAIEGATFFFCLDHGQATSVCLAVYFRNFQFESNANPLHAVTFWLVIRLPGTVIAIVFLQ